MRQHTWSKSAAKFSRVRVVQQTKSTNALSEVDTNCDGKLEVGDFIHTLIRSPAPAGLSSVEDTIRVLKATKSLSARIVKFKEMQDEARKQ